MTVKARRNYAIKTPGRWDGTVEERVRVLGHEQINGETWHRCRFEGGGVMMVSDRMFKGAREV